ncbi:MAG: peptidylprolyl isomerase [Rikenellaceae bacterium]
MSLLLFSFSSFAKEKVVKVKKGNIFVVTMTTNRGDIVMQLSNRTPLHRDNFVKLSTKGFYDKVLFHRVINDFMIQAGDSTTKNRLPEARKSYGESNESNRIKAEILPDVYHYRGALGAARDMNPAKASSAFQFYIVQCPVTEKLKTKVEEMVSKGKMTREVGDEYLKRGGTPHLDGNYTVFGSVLKGMNVVDAIANVKCGAKDCPVEDIEIVSVKVKQVKEKKLYKYE